MTGLHIPLEATRPIHDDRSGLLTLLAGAVVGCGTGFLLALCLFAWKWGWSMTLRCIPGLWGG